MKKLSYCLVLSLSLAACGRAEAPSCVCSGPPKKRCRYQTLLTAAGVGS